MVQFIPSGSGDQSRRIAVLARAGKAPAVVWLGGFRSDMRATKAERLDAWADRAGRALLRFDYSAHGESPSDFENATLTQWLEDALAAIEWSGHERPILVGSSMGGWIALLATRRLLQARSPSRPSGLVLIAPAPDFTERLMWNAFPEEMRRTIVAEGRILQPSPYSDEPYPITLRLIEDGRRHLLLDGRPIETGCPVHIIQGMRDPDVPWQLALELVEHLPGESVSLTLIKDGDHRLSRPEDLDRIVAAVEAMIASVGDVSSG